MPTIDEINRVKAQMSANSQKWHTADATTRKQLENENLSLGTGIGAKRNEAAGTWDYSGVKADPVDYAAQAQAQIGKMMEAERAARLQALRAQQQKATGQLNQQKAEVKPQYQDKRNQASFQSAKSVQALREAMANAGLYTSGERFNNQTGEGAANIARENALNGLNIQEQQTLNDFNRRIADVNDPSQEMQIEAALNAEKARMLYDAQNRAQDLQFRDSQFDYQKQRDTSNDAFRNEEFAYRKSFDQKQFDEDARRFGLTYALQQAGVTGFLDGKPTFAREQFNSENDYRNRSLAEAAASRQASAAAAAARASATQEATAAKQKSAQATASAIAQAMTYDDYGSAMNALRQYAPQMQAEGVDLESVLDAINKRYTRPKESPLAGYMPE